MIAKVGRVSLSYNQKSQSERFHLPPSVTVLSRPMSQPIRPVALWARLTGIFILFWAHEKDFLLALNFNHSSAWDCLHVTLLWNVFGVPAVIDRQGPGCMRLLSIPILLYWTQLPNSSWGATLSTIHNLSLRLVPFIQRGNGTADDCPGIKLAMWLWASPADSAEATGISSKTWQCNWPKQHTCWYAILLILGGQRSPNTDPSPKPPCQEPSPLLLIFLHFCSTCGAAAVTEATQGDEWASSLSQPLTLDPAACGTTCCWSLQRPPPLAHLVLPWTKRTWNWLCHFSNPFLRQSP